MNTKAIRLYGSWDLRLEEFPLPEMKDDEILAKIVSDSICMSSYKAAELGSSHKRIPENIDENPVIIGHEFCGELIRVGKKWKNDFKTGDKFSIQPALNDPKDPYATPGYSFQFIGGNATYVIIPARIIELNCLLKYTGQAYYYGSLAEPMSCIIGGYHINYHTVRGSYKHRMGIVKGGNLAILAGAGPMGLGAIDYAIHAERKPALLVVTDIDAVKLARAESIYSSDEAVKHGIKLIYINTSNIIDVPAYLRSFTHDCRGFDDVFVYTPIKSVVEQGDKILSIDGCLNFFAGPTDSLFSAECNFYNVHYLATHIVGNSGGNTADMIESLELMAKGHINPSSMITHIGGLDSVIDTTINLPKIPGGKKLIYTQISLPLTAIDDFKKIGAKDSLFAKLADITADNNGLWCYKAEKLLLEKARPI